jgi:NADPH:quinone reductase-like Zn-dependent oxidoreductase
MAPRAIAIGTKIQGEVMPSEYSLELRSKITRCGTLELSLAQTVVREPAADEMVVRIEAAPLNPSDIGTLLGPADPSSFRSAGTAERPITTATLPAERIASVQARFDMELPAGNEAAGVVVKSGTSLQPLLGREVSVFGPGMYAQYRVLKAADCLVLPRGTSTRDGAAAFVNPLTVLGMLETMRREGHAALVHTAAASSVGQMLNRVCLADGVALVNIVRNPSQVALLRELGAKHVIDSSNVDFKRALFDAIAETRATLAFDAIGGGTMAATILASMEAALTAGAPYGRYGSTVHKQLYIYGGLNPGPKVIEGNFGMAWAVGGWLMTSCLEEIGIEAAMKLRERVAAELTTTFATHYTAEISLAEALSPTVIAAYSRRATGEKYLIRPNGKSPGIQTQEEELTCLC